MKTKLIPCLVMLCCISACSFSQQKKAVKKITVAAADSLVALPANLQKQLAAVSNQAGHLIFTGESKLTETGSRWLAAKKQQPMYRVDLSAVTGKYIGETEKNLDKIFTEASENKAVLLIDEADALFGKRTNVQDAHDKYSNAEVAYLLKRIATYQGTVIIHCNTDDCIKQSAVAGLVKIDLQ